MRAVPQSKVVPPNQEQPLGIAGVCPRTPEERSALGSVLSASDHPNRSFAFICKAIMLVATTKSTANHAMPLVSRELAIVPVKFELQAPRTEPSWSCDADFRLCIGVDGLSHQSAVRRISIEQARRGTDIASASRTERSLT